MFTEVAVEDLLREVRTHDFGADPMPEFGAGRIDAITALDRVIRAAQAEQLAQIAALHDERVDVMPVGRADPTLSVIGESGMARNITPSVHSLSNTSPTSFDRVKDLVRSGPEQNEQTEEGHCRRSTQRISKQQRRAYCEADESEPTRTLVRR